MSSDIFVSKKALEKAGVKFVSVLCDLAQFTYPAALFPGHEYTPEVTLSPEGMDQVHISCGGSFRSWLQQFLKNNSIEYEML